jgi:hypothetical protein
MVGASGHGLSRGIVSLAGQARLGRGLSTDGPDNTDGRAGPLGEMGTDEEEG